MADLKANPVKLVEERIGEAADDAIRSVREVAHNALSDVRTVAEAKAALPATCDDLVAKAALALVKDVEVGMIEIASWVSVSLGANTIRLHESAPRDGILLPAGRYRLLLLALPLAGKE